jgi:hypothetical protein
MTKESSPMMKAHTGNASSLRWVGVLLGMVGWEVNDNEKEKGLS